MLVRHCADARYVHNLGLEQRSFWRRGMSSISVYDQKRSLTEARQGTWLGEGSSVVQQQALFDLDRAFQNWWKNPAHFSRPTWRKAGIHEGFAIRDLSVRRINRKWGKVFVPKCGWVRFRISRQWMDIAAGTSARVTLDRAGRWHVSFTCPPPTFERKPTGAVVGIDRGVKNTIATSDGPMSNIPTWTAASGLATSLSNAGSPDNSEAPTGVPRPRRSSGDCTPSSGTVGRTGSRRPPPSLSGTTT